jgi:hypothetical protein
LFVAKVREFGSVRLASEVLEYKELMKGLRRACDPEGKEFRAAERFLPRCKPGQVKGKTQTKRKKKCEKKKRAHF